MKLTNIITTCAAIIGAICLSIMAVELPKLIEAIKDNTCFISRVQHLEDRVMRDLMETRTQRVILNQSLNTFNEIVNNYSSETRKAFKQANLKWKTSEDSKN